MGCAGSHNDDGTALGISPARIVFVEKLRQSKSVTGFPKQTFPASPTNACL
jgi:hypothetical protein